MRTEPLPPRVRSRRNRTTEANGLGRPVCSIEMRGVPSPASTDCRPTEKFAAEAELREGIVASLTRTRTWFPVGAVTVHVNCDWAGWFEATLFQFTPPSKET